MAKVRSLSELEDQLDKDSLWRKRELTTTRFLVEGARMSEQALLTRIALCMLYAHWEGFVKGAARSYLLYVQSAAPLSSLRDCFRAVHLARDIQQCGKVTKRWPERYEKLVASVQLMSGTMKFEDEMIDTESNLNSIVLSQILSMIGISLKNLTSIHTSVMILDHDLLGNRNKIAHGERVEVSTSDFLQLHGRVVDWISVIKTEILNAASQKSFLRERP